MGRIRRIVSAILKETNFHQVKEVKVSPISQNNLLTGKAALVTGGASGIGVAIAEALVRCGAYVILAGRSEERLLSATDKLGSDRVSYVVLDVKNLDSIKSAVHKASDLLSDKYQLSILVNSAGVAQGGSFLGVDEVSYDAVLDTNLKGTFFMSQTFANYMIDENIKGHILNISSSSALRNAKTPYEISKWGIKGLTLGFAEELIKYGIVVNAIAPGPTATGMIAKNNNTRNLTHTANPSGRLATPDEVANIAVLMVSGMFDLVVGDTIYVSGGAGTICIDR